MTNDSSFVFVRTRVTDDISSYVAFFLSLQGQPIHRLEGPRLRGLLTKARKLGGDRLSIDIMETEAALRLFDRVEGSATVIQVRD